MPYTAGGSRHSPHIAVHSTYRERRDRPLWHYGALVRVGVYGSADCRACMAVQLEWRVPWHGHVATCGADFPKTITRKLQNKPDNTQVAEMFSIIDTLLRSS